MSGSVRFLGDGPVGRGRGASLENRRAASELRGRPGEWGQWPREYGSEESAVVAAWRIRRGGLGCGPSGAFDARAVGRVVLVRFLGGSA